MGDGVYIEGEEIYPGEGNINDDPMFIDSAAGDYRLQRGSPDIDTGSNRPWMTDATDLAGFPRIMMGTVDMGCYETIPPQGNLILVR